MATTMPTTRFRVESASLPDKVVLQQRRIDGCYNGVDLRGVAGAEDSQNAEQRVKHRQKLPSACPDRF